MAGLSVLPGEVVLHCMSFLDPFAVCALSACSRHFWGLGQDDGLWRALVDRDLAPSCRPSLPSFQATVRLSHRTWKAIYQEECARVPRVGFAMVSLKELVMAELNPWRMKDITTIPINGPTISKNQRGGKSALRFARLRLEILHRFHIKAHGLITAHWFSPRGESGTEQQSRIQVLVVGVVEPVKPEPFSGDLFPLVCRVVKPVALPHGGTRGLQSLLCRYLEEQAQPETPFLRACHSLGCFFALLQDEATPRYVTFPDLGPALRQGKIETLLISEELLDKWLVVCSSREGSTAEAEKMADLHLLDVVPRQDEARANCAEAIYWPQMREWVNNVRWQCGLTQLHWVSSCSDPGKVFAQTFGIAGILKDGVTFTSCHAAPRAPKGRGRVIPRRDGQELTHQQFSEEFDVPAQPVILTSIASQWPLLSCVAEDLAELSGTQLVRVTDEDDTVTTMAFAEYLDRVSWDERLSVTEEADQFPHLTGAWAVPCLFGPNLYETIPSGMCPPYKYLIVSASGFGTPLHTEPDGASTWLALLSGRKRWVVFPRDADLTTLPNYHEGMSALEFFSQVYPHIDTRRQVVWEGVQEAGEILYVPSGCAHVVLTLDASVAISVDFINDVNLPFIAPHLRALICSH